MLSVYMQLRLLPHFNAGRHVHVHALSHTTARKRLQVTREPPRPSNLQIYFSIRVNFFRAQRAPHLERVMIPLINSDVNFHRCSCARTTVFSVYQQSPASTCKSGL